MKKKIINLFYFCAALLVLASCSKDDEPLPLIPTQFTELKADVNDNLVKLSISIVTDKMLNEAECGFVMSESPSPTINDKKIVAKKDGKILTASVEALKQQTTYYVRGYVKKSQTEYEYSKEISFSTWAPTLFTELKAEVDYEVIKLSVSISADKILDDAERGFVMSESPSPTINDKKIVAQRNGKVLTASVEALKEQTTYYVRGYVKKSETEYEYSEEISFSTWAPTLFTELKAEVDYEVIKLSVSITADKMFDDAERGFVIAENSLPTVENQKIIAEKKETLYSALAEGLKEKTAYYVRAYLKKTDTEYIYSDEISFLTLVLADKEKIVVEGGSFNMGGNAESDQKPIHTVTLKGFKMDAKEVTYAKYANFLNNVQKDPRGIKIPSDITLWIYVTDSRCKIEKQGKKYVVKDGKEDFPVGWIRYPGAKAYAQWVGGRLPSEAEREYAALGGQKSKNYTFAGGNKLDEVGWFIGNSDEKVHPVGQKLPNELGLYDMSGNVGEWCVDSYHGEETGYNGAPNDGSAWTVPEGRGHIIRGGSFQSQKWDCTSKYRTYNAWYYSGDNVGFRVVYDLEEK